MNSRDIWLFLFIVGLLLFSWPSIEMFSLSLHYYLFIIWGVFILIIGLVSTLYDGRGRGGDV